uniref:DUF7746 domain-containing protein n=1 Tax=Glycine max TaxID=3847 RepID=A0A0R0K963_SOYBN
MNTWASRVLLKPQRGETTLFIIDMTKVNVALPRTIKWDEVTLPKKWAMDKATSIEASRSEYESARRYFSVRTWSIPVGLSRSESHNQFSSINLQRLDTTSSIPRTTYNQKQEDDQKENLDYPWKQDIIGDPTTNVITNWQIKDGELIQWKLPPTTQYQLPKVKNSNDKHVMATPFKTKDVNEDITSKDIRSLMEQANYTKKYLQVLVESISREKVSPKHKIHEESTSNIQIEKPLFKPFKEESSKIRTRNTSKLINVINDNSDQNSEQITEEGSISEKDINPINTKHWKTPSKLYYQRPTTPDLLLEERGEKYNIMNTLRHMTMISHECSEETIIDILVAGFSGQLKGCVVKMDLNGKVITNDDNKEILDPVNTLIFTIAQHFIGDPSLWKDRSAELLSNLKFGLPRSLGDKARDKIHSQSVNGDISYENLSYGQLISYVQKVALKICQDDKIQRQLAKEKAQTKRDLGSFCEQFGLPTCPKQKKKQSPKKGFHENKTFNKKRFPIRKYSHKPSTSKDTNTTKPSMKTKIVCYNYGKQGHISKYYRLKKKLRNLNLDPSIEEHINNMLIETSEEETKDVSSKENINLIQQDDQPSSMDDEDTQEIKF